MGWGASQTKLFARLYLSHKFLWDPGHSDYRSQARRKEAYRDIICKFHAITNILLHEKDVTTKIRILRSTYFAQLSIIKSRSSTGAPYKPTLSWFPMWHESFRKIKRNNELAGTEDSSQKITEESEDASQKITEESEDSSQKIWVNVEEDNGENSSEIEKETSAMDEDYVEEISAVDDDYLKETSAMHEDYLKETSAMNDDYLLLLKSEPAYEEKPYKKKKYNFGRRSTSSKAYKNQSSKAYKNQSSKTFMDTLETSSILNKTSEAKEDEFDIYGKYIASQLRTMDIERALKAQLQIQSIVSQARIESITGE